MKNVKTNGFDSKSECKRYNELWHLEKVGVISDLQKQVKIVLQESFNYQGKTKRSIIYIADFKYYHNEKKTFVYEDLKSSFTAKNPVYRLKIKLLLKKLLTTNENAIFLETIKK